MSFRPSFYIGICSKKYFSSFYPNQFSLPALCIYPVIYPENFSFIWLFLLLFLVTYSLVEVTVYRHVAPNPVCSKCDVISSRDSFPRFLDHFPIEMQMLSALMFSVLLFSNSKFSESFLFSCSLYGDIVLFYIQE